MRTQAILGHGKRTVAACVCLCSRQGTWICPSAGKTKWRTLKLADNSRESTNIPVINKRESLFLVMVVVPHKRTASPIEWDVLHQMHLNLTLPCPMPGISYRGIKPELTIQHQYLTKALMAECKQILTAVFQQPSQILRGTNSLLLHLISGELLYKPLAIQCIYVCTRWV